MECKHGHDNERDGFTCGSCIREDRERRDQLNRDAKDANLVALRAAIDASQAECERMRSERDDAREQASDFAMQDEARRARIAELEAECERLRARIERAQRRLDANPVRQPDYLALSADLRGEVGRVNGEPQYDSAALAAGKVEP